MTVVVAPLSVVDHWQKEFEKYASTVKTLRYIGEKEEREELRGKLKKRDPSVDFNVLITTPELLRADSEFLQRYKWRYGIIDEAHRLKNPYLPPVSTFPLLACLAHLVSVRITVKAFFTPRSSSSA
jgi:SNF2 family DNA or RNA helicase